MRSEPAEKQRGLFPLAVLSLLAGMVSGLLGAVFRLLLDQADRLRDTLIAWAHGERLVGFLLVVAACAGATAVAAWLVRRFSPQAEGSGIPNVELVARGELPTPPYRLVPVKFLGGLLAIGSGLALGREGPSVQMGASTAHLLGKLFRRNEDDCKTLLAAGAGAGLATAFNAPIGGAVFVLEELVRRFDTRTTVVTLGASAGAIAVARVLLGDAPDFHVEPLPYPGFGTVPIHLALGIVAGLLGVAYNRVLLGTLAASERLHRWPVELRAALVGTAVGMTAWFAPDWVGGGDAITQGTLGRHRDRCHTADYFSVSVRTRSGILRGTDAGRIVRAHPGTGISERSSLRHTLNQWFPTLQIPHPTALAIVGMAGVFHRGGAGPGHRYHIGHRDDGELYLAFADAQRLFRGDAGAKPAARCAIYDSLRERTLRKSA